MVIVAVLGGVALAAVAVVLSIIRDPLSDEPIDRPDAGLPERELRADDIPALRFRVGLRGYRMEDVDRAMAALEASLRQAESRARNAR